MSVIELLTTFSSERGCGKSGRGVCTGLDGSGRWGEAALRGAGLCAHPGAQSPAVSRRDHVGSARLTGAGGGVLAGSDHLGRRHRALRRRTWHGPLDMAEAGDDRMLHAAWRGPLRCVAAFSPGNQPPDAFLDPNLCLPP